MRFLIDLSCVWVAWCAHTQNNGTTTYDGSNYDARIRIRNWVVESKIQVRANQMLETYFNALREIFREVNVVSGGTDPEAAEIAYCGLYCVECRWLTEGKCRSCKNDPRNSMCPTYGCASKRGEESCLLCDTYYYKECPTWREGILSIHHRPR